MIVLLLTAGSALAAPNGKQLFGEKCAACHGYDGHGGVGVPLALPDFQISVTDAYLRKTIRHGRPGRVMPSFDTLSDAQIDAIVQYIRTWLPKGKSVSLSTEPVHGNPTRGKALFASHCASCHGDHGQGGEGTGVTFSRPRNLPIIPPALNNPGFLASASDAMIKATLERGRTGTPMVSFLKHGMSKQDINDVVAYVRSFAKQAHPTNADLDEPPTLSETSSYSVEETVANIKRAVVGRNFRIIRIQTLDYGLVPADKENHKEVIVYFCNFDLINKVLAIDPRLGLFMPCRVTVVEQNGVVKVLAMNPKFMSRFYNNDELGHACEDMKNTYQGILDEATL